MTRRGQRVGIKRTPLVPRVKVWLETQGHYALGFGLSQILEAVEKAGSIKQAANDLGKSYRYVWGRIKEAEKALRAQLVATQVGGHGNQRSTLTPAARALVRDFFEVRRRMQAIVVREFGRHFSWPIARSP